MADILGGKVCNSCSRDENAIVLVVNIGSFLVDISCCEVVGCCVELQEIVLDVQDEDDFAFGRLDGSRVKIRV